MHVEHENHLREVCFRPLSTSHHRRHRTPPKRAFMLVFGGLTFSGHHHNDDNAENREDGCASPILQQGMFSFDNVYLLTISSLPTGYWGDTCSPHTHSEHDKEGSSLPHQYHPLLVFEGHSLPPPPFSMVFEAGSFLPPPPFATITTLLPRKHAYEAGCSLPPPPFSLENKRVRLFSRTVVLCHHHHPPPSRVCSVSRLDLFHSE